jgi:Tfp pilus assembly PilM family ATPase
MKSLGMYIEGDAIHVAIASKAGSCIAFETLESFPKSEEGIQGVKALYNALISFDKEAYIASALRGDEVFIRSLSIPLKNQQAVLRALTFELEGIFPFPLQQMSITPFFARRGPYNVHIAAAKKEVISSHLSDLKAYAIDNDVLSCTPQALSRLVHFLHPENTSAIAIDIGYSRISAALISEGILIASYSATTGLGSALQPLFQERVELKECSTQELDSYISDNQSSLLLYHPFSQGLKAISKEVESVLLYFENKQEDSSSFPLMICGQIATMPALQKLIIEPILQSSRPLLGLKDLEKPQCSIAAGCALDAIAKDGKGINFCQKEHLSCRSFSRRIKKLYTLGLCSLSLFIAAYIAAEVGIRKERNKIKALCSMPGSTLTFTEDIDAMASKISASFGKLKKSTSLALGIPSAAHLLSWLSSHPHLKVASSSPSHIEVIDIQKVHYIAGKSGELKTPQFAKVELELFTPSTRAARDFYASLQRGEGLVDASRPITWSGKDGLYKTSFYLKGL